MASPLLASSPMSSSPLLASDAVNVAAFGVAAVGVGAVVDAVPVDSKFRFVFTFAARTGLLHILFGSTDLRGEDVGR